MSNNKKVNRRMGKRVKKRKLRRRVYFILIPLIVFLSALGFFVNLYLKAGSVISDSYEDDGRLKSDLREKEVDPKFDNVSILIMGVDGGEKRGTEGIRTDTLMVATLNKDDKTVKLLSIPRDTKVYVQKLVTRQK
ncbi:LCP family glycopolymer transferase [Paracerasibacillus soli]|uniref:LCP family protein n=1 Tax=Paracerasibacillus soli TaxID=480284 RepID=A0ABU5CT62_9BACI|nr:LCP family protein [Virgibacillus soli]MDY0409430.1 LCP family protein [Virgibacillus soli]